MNREAGRLAWVIRLRQRPAGTWLADVQVKRLDPGADHGELRQCYEMLLSGRAQDDPHGPTASYRGFRGWWVYGFGANPQQVWLATADSGEPVGAYLLELPERENRTTGFPFVLVAQSARRRGLGTALLAHAAARAETAGRTLLISQAREESPGSAFAAAVGARPSLRDVRRTLAVDDGLSERLPRLRAEASARAGGYRLHKWTGPTPAEMVDRVCRLYEALADAPHEEAVEPESWDADRLAQAEQRVIEEGTRWYSIAAIDEARGDMAALTQLGVDPDVPEWGFQGITAVTRQHRGHRLGLLVKVAMLEWLGRQEPDMRQVMTFNAEANEHMIAVNEQLGNRISDYFRAFELDVAAARKLVSGH